MKKTYPYKPKTWLMLVGVLLFGFATWHLTYKALNPDRGVNFIIIKNIIEIPIPVEHAAGVYGTLAFLGALMTLLTLYATIIGLISKAQIILSEDSISLPVNIFKLNKVVTIPYKEIISLDVQNVGNNVFLTIVHKKGKDRFSTSNVPKREMFDEIVNHLLKQVKKK